MVNKKLGQNSSRSLLLGKCNHPIYCICINAEYVGHVPSLPLLLDYKEHLILFKGGVSANYKNKHNAFWGVSPCDQPPKQTRSAYSLSSGDLFSHLFMF